MAHHKEFAFIYISYWEQKINKMLPYIPLGSQKFYVYFKHSSLHSTRRALLFFWKSLWNTSDQRLKPKALRKKKRIVFKHPGQLDCFQKLVLTFMSRTSSVSAKPIRKAIWEKIASNTQDILISVEQQKQQKTNRDSDLKTLCSEMKKIKKLWWKPFLKKKKKEQKESLNALEGVNSVNLCTELCGIKMERAKQQRKRWSLALCTYCIYGEISNVIKEEFLINPSTRGMLDAHKSVECESASLPVSPGKRNLR